MFEPLVIADKCCVVDCQRLAAIDVLQHGLYAVDERWVQPRAERYFLIACRSIGSAKELRSSVDDSQSKRTSLSWK